jgi:hypothetical protein
MRVFVIMGNDFPAGVMQAREDAEKLCAEKNTADAIAADRDRRGRIYWRYYPFKLNKAP